MRFLPTLTRASLGVALIATAAIAATPQETIAARQQNFKSLGRANKMINDELRKPAPALAIVRPYAAALERFSAQIPGWFPAGSGQEAGIKTGASPAIWQNRGGFNRAAANFRTASQTLVRTGRGNDVAAITAAARAVGGTCKACHDDFRLKND